MSEFDVVPKDVFAPLPRGRQRKAWCRGQRLTVEQAVAAGLPQREPEPKPVELHAKPENEPKPTKERTPKRSAGVL